MFDELLRKLGNILLLDDYTTFHIDDDWRHDQKCTVKIGILVDIHIAKVPENMCKHVRLGSTVDVS